MGEDAQPKPSRVHLLKTAAPWFDEVWNERKPFEVRRNDRDFRAGDVVVLLETDARGFYTPRRLIFRIGYVLTGFPGLRKGWCAFGLLVPNDDELCDADDALRAAGLA